MSKGKFDLIKKRSVQGVIALVSRQYVLQGFAAVANILFGILLLPAEYGTYFLVLAVVSILNYFADIGLGAALIQKKKALTRSDLVTTFTIQQGLTLILMTVALASTKFVSDHYNFSTSEVELYFALIVSLLFASLKSIPSVLLERELAFHKLIISQILEHFVFYGVAVTLAWQGFGVKSFTIAVLARGVVGLLAIYIIRPWKPALGINFKVAKRLVSFGAPFQANSLLALIKDDLLIAVLGGFLSRTEMGYITWAHKWTKLPLTAFLNSVLTVTFPVFSRLQTDKRELSKALEKALFFVSLTVFPSVIGIVAVSQMFFMAFPRFEKWLPATTAINYFGVVMIIAAISTVLTSTLNSIGKVKRTLMLMVMWIILTWTLTLTLINVMGFNGVAVAAALTSLSSVVVIPMVKQFIDFKILPQILPAFVSSMLMFVVIKLVEPQLAINLISVSGLILLGGVTYLSCMLVFFGSKTRKELLSLKQYVRVK